MNYRPIRPTTQRRYALINERFNELYEMKIEGMRLNKDDIIKKIADETGYSVVYVTKIVKGY